MLANVGKVPNAQQVADRIAIGEVLALHSRGLDRVEESTLKSCYWSDAEVDYGTFVGSAHQFAELVMQALAGTYELTRHCIGNTLIAFDGNDLANCESCVNADHLFIGAKQEMQFAGRYLDTLEKRDGVWKMKHRRVVIDWSRTVDVVDERGSEAFVAMAKGAHSEADPSHAHFSNN
ncbi:MAG: nuclear transport factor 2 family protein [Pseudomonadales bacterium]